MTTSDESSPVLEAQTEVLVAGTAKGLVLRLDEPLSMWGGFDSHDGMIIDARHPQTGQCATGKVLVMATGRGSSSASSVLVEAIARKTAPAAIVLGEADSIISLGAVVASELYEIDVPVLVASPEFMTELETGMAVEVDRDGVCRLTRPGN